MSLHPGLHVKQYVIGEMLAKGGMGVVWRAEDTQSDQPVAIKAVANDLIVDPDFRSRMQDEARRHQRLHHPNIVPVPDVFDAAGETCIVMKLIGGLSLATLLDHCPNKRLGVEEAVRIVKDILNALNYAHRQGIVHRDVKPANVMVEREGKVWLLDFGIALAMGEQRRTRTGQTVGTLLYMSPEQIIKPRSIDHRSDVYSVGCMLYEMVTGQAPFVKNQDGIADSDFAIQQAHVNKTPVHPKTRVLNIPDELDEIIMTALNKNPDDRIPGCGEFLRLLEQLDSPPDVAVGGTPKDRAVTRWIMGFLVTIVLIFFVYQFLGR